MSITSRARPSWIRFCNTSLDVLGGLGSVQLRSHFRRDGDGLLACGGSQRVMARLDSVWHPDFIIPLLIILILGVQLHVFSVADTLGRVDPTIEPGFTLEYIGSVLSHAILPVLTYVAATVGGWILTMKSSTLSTLGEEYVTVAHARGLPQRRVLTAYVGRNAMLPLVTRLAISIGFVVGGSVIIEDIYRYRGLGKFLTTAIVARDYTSMQGVFLVIAISVVVANMLADVLYGVLDPRVRIGRER